MLVLLGRAVAIKSCRDPSTSCDIGADANANRYNPLLTIYNALVNGANN